MSRRGDLASVPVFGSADVEQGEYFYRLLDQRKGELCELLEDQLDLLAGVQRVGDLAAVRRKRRHVAALESDIHTIDRMLRALRVRLGWPTLPRTS